ncbi:MULTISPECIES: efflux transporter outer membrane subunit [Gammaproteobacteria]|uniref:Efflux transporter outer membrane subunit n=1 Tax=Vreelandella halophila TaxID=86177 RepID=A0A9X4YAL0_9GAMM|nr:MULTISPECIES: efflux transporter outer membrane subunit [Gammaproteobacteria]KAA8981243.1 efflux transporter outer membrane subunit [Halospina sp. K52047b]MYL26214.1 efflux transporter outer membrane subunit [Halomonas utahensis]MYL73224.1 efflux transporter outer membrane subunit [Halomonas sp. 22501_18_FS]
MRRILFATLMFPLLLAGCAVGPAYEEPQVDLPEEWPDEVLLTGEERADWSNWWHRFDDPVLNRLVERALDDNLNMQLQYQRLQEARARLGLADAQQMPTVEGQADAARGRESGAANPLGGGTTSNMFSVTGLLSYEVDLWGKLESQSDAAEAALQESVFTHDSVRLSTVADVVATYTELRAAQRSLAITERTLETREETVRIERARYEGGDTNELTLRQAVSELEATRALVPQQRQRVAQLKTALGVLVGMTPRELTSELDFGEGSLSDITLPEEVPEVLPSDLLERRPDIRAAEAAIIAATEEVGVAQAQRLPSFNLRGSFGSAAIESDDLFTGPAETWEIGASVLGPIFDFGRNKARVEAAQSLRDQAETQYRVTLQQAFREVRDALAVYEATDERVSRLRDQVEALEKTLELAELRYEEGLTDFLTVQDTQRVLLDAELTLTNAIRDRLNATATLFKAMGGGWADGKAVEPESGDS